MKQRIGGLMKISALFYAVVILAFFMPFFMVSCEKTELLRINGIQLVTGGESELKMDNVFSGLGGSNEEDSKSQKINRHPMAIIALVIAVIALILCLILPNKLYFVPTLLSIAGIICLHLLKNSMLGLVAKADVGMDLTKFLRVSPLYGFWVADFAFIVGAVLALLTGRRKLQEDRAIAYAQNNDFADPMAFSAEDYTPDPEYTDSEADVDDIPEEEISTEEPEENKEQ